MLEINKFVARQLKSLKGRDPQDPEILEIQSLLDQTGKFLSLQQREAAIKTECDPILRGIRKEQINRLISAGVPEKIGLDVDSYKDSLPDFTTEPYQSTFYRIKDRLSSKPLIVDTRVDFTTLLRGIGFTVPENLLNDYSVTVQAPGYHKTTDVKLGDTDFFTPANEPVHSLWYQMLYRTNEFRTEGEVYQPMDVRVNQGFKYHRKYLSATETANLVLQNAELIAAGHSIIVPVTADAYYYRGYYESTSLMFSMGKTKPFVYLVQKDHSPWDGY